MACIEHDVIQGTPEWFDIRKGKVTASAMSTVMASGKTPGTRSLTRDKYMRQLAAEILTDEICEENYQNFAMDRGHVMEDDIRREYALMHDVSPRIVGFVTNGPKGYSPDSFIGDDGILEVKSKRPDILIECLQANRFPAEHRNQCQAGLWISERQWADIAIGWVSKKGIILPLFVKREYRDESLILQMKIAVDKFNQELIDLVNKIRIYGANPAALTGVA